MALQVILNKPRVYRLLIEEYPEGAYLYVFESPTAPGPYRDYLQTDVEMAKRAAKQDYGVPEDVWEEVPNENWHGEH